MYKNIVFQKVMEIKREYIQNFQDIFYDFDEKNSRTCIEKWIEKLITVDEKYQEYRNIFKYLQLVQYNTKQNVLLLIRYANYSDIYSGEEEVTDEEFWKLYDGFYQECRSIVIDIKNDEIILLPFKKFFNIGQDPEVNYDNLEQYMKNASTLEISEKLDGSMFQARYIPKYDKIFTSTSQALDENNSWRLKEANEMLNKLDVNLFTEYPNCTFVFEYISLKDAHVVCYKPEEQGLYLIGIINMNGHTYNYNYIKFIANFYKCKSMQIYNKTFEEMMEDIKNKKSNEQEGFVLNIDGKLLKLKTDDYVGIHKILSKISSINLIIKNIADGTYDDLLSKIPTAYKSRIEKVAKVVFDYITEMETKTNTYYTLAPKQDKKTFMLWVNVSVPSELQSSVRNRYLGINNNYLKRGSGKTPQYIKLKQIIGDTKYSDIFIENTY